MTRGLKKQLDLAKMMLRILGEKTMHRSDWNILCQISATRFQRMLKFLMENNYVTRISHGIYRRTERGRSFAEAI